MKENRIPSFYVRLFSWFCKSDFFEELQGDLEEAFYENSSSLGPKKARSIYRLEVIKMIRPSVIQIKLHHKLNFLIMFRNYFKTSIRSLKKNPLSSFINIIGLSSALGVCIFTYAFTEYTYRTDQFHENKDNVFLVTFFTNREGQEQQIGTTPRPLAKMMVDDFPEIKSTSQVDNRNVIVKHGTNTFHESVRLVDPSFLEMFTFPLKWGSAGSLQDINSIVINEKMSTKYFGDENPIGQSLMVKFGKDHRKSFQVTAVISEPHDESSLFFDFLIHHDNIKIAEPDYDPSDWTKQTHATLAHLNSPNDIHSLKHEMEKYRLLYNSSQSDWQISGFGFEPLSTIHYQSHFIRDDIFFSNYSNYESFIFLFVVSGFLLALACFNYINIAIVTASKRLKEISLRKVIGASRSMIATQFLAENLMLTSIAAVFGLALGSTVFIPWFEGLFLNHFQMDLDYGDYRLYIFLAGIVLVTGLSSGLYPSFYIARFQVVSIMKGSLKFGKKNSLTRILLGLQLVLACIVITTGIMFSMNHQYIAQRSWGYDYHDVIYAGVPDQSAYVNLSNAMRQNPNVVALAGSSNHLGKGEEKVIVNQQETEYEVVQLAIGADYFETLGLELTEGRSFHADHESDQNALVINELMVEKLSFLQPIGKTLKIQGERFQIIGVVKNFHNRSFASLLKPTMIRLAKKEDFRYLTIKIKEGKQIETYVDLQTQWSSLFPEDPFLGGHQEDVWGNYFKAIASHGSVWRGFAFIATLLTALGLYGLVTLNVTGRMQEFSIRKVLGARIENIGNTLLKQYALLFVLAIAIGAPLSYYANEFILNFAYNYHMPMGIGGTLMAAVLLVLILIFVVIFQVVKLAQSNPSEGLRSE